MPVTDAMRARHVVRQYLDTPLPADVSAALRERVIEANASHGTDIRLLTGSAPVYGPLWGTVRARSVRNCLVMAGPQAPDWFTQGVEAALLAPTAFGKQSFTLTGKDAQVTIRCTEGDYAGQDRGIIKYHFEVGAEPDTFTWTN